MALSMPLIIGKQAWAERTKSLTLMSPRFLERALRMLNELKGISGENK